jgi:hypothetical protein
MTKVISTNVNTAQEYQNALEKVYLDPPLSFTTAQLIASTAVYPAATVINTPGFSTSGDGGFGSWKQNGVTGQTVSQSPAQLGLPLFNDGNGNQWAMLLTNTASFETFAQVEASTSGNVGQKLTCRARALAVYLIQPPGYVALTGDATLASGLVAALQVDSEVLREDMAAPTGADLVGTAGGGTVQELLQFTSVSTILALSTSGTGRDIYLNLAKRKGVFNFSSADLSAQVTLDPLQGIYVAPSADATGASGAWVRDYTELHAEYFGAGEALNDTPAFLAMLVFGRQGLTLSANSALYNCDTEIAHVFGRSQDGVDINFTGDFIFQSVNGFNLKDKQNGTTRIGTIAYKSLTVDDPTAAAGVGITLSSLWAEFVDIKGTVNFITSNKLIGGDLGTSGNGMAFNEIHIRNANSPKTNGNSCVITTLPFSTTPGYFNENHLHIGFMRGSIGIDVIKGPLQTDPFNGNKFHSPQVEDVDDIGIQFEFCRTNTILWPRFEGGGEPNTYWLNEKSDCFRNDYYLTDTADNALFNFQGSFQNIFGRRTDASGGLVINQRWGGNNSTGDNNDNDLNLAIRLTANAPNNTLAFGGIPGDTRWQKYVGIVKDDLGVTKVFGLLDPYGTALLTNTDGITQVPESTSFIEASTTGASDLTLVMPFNREINGLTMHMNISFYNFQLAISKSNGTVTIPFGEIISTGMYLLIYRSGSWEFSRVGDAMSN